jgi:hypothetical protein
MMDDSMIVYKVRPSYFDEQSEGYLTFPSSLALATYLNWTDYPCTVSTVSRRTHECITASS